MEGGDGDGYYATPTRAGSDDESDGNKVEKSESRIWEMKTKLAMTPQADKHAASGSRMLQFVRHGRRDWSELAHSNQTKR